MYRKKKNVFARKRRNDVSGKKRKDLLRNESTN
jgi:hypothetical protein